MRVLVIGGGPAGLLAAITAAKNNNEVILLEKMKSCGRKLLITGKGRCNITSSLEIDEFIKNIPGNGKFMYSALKNYTNEDILKLLHKNGVKTKLERGNRIFPESDKSIDVLNALLQEAKKYKVNIKTNVEVKNLIVEANKALGVEAINLELNKQETYYGEKIILATGGKSYPNTGSTGDGYKIAKKVGHKIQEIKPSLVPLEAGDISIKLCKSLQGLSLRNIKMKIVDENKNKVIYEDFGEMIFTHFGVSGPTILSSSAHILRYKDIETLLKNNKVKLYIDLKPALDIKKLDARILRDFEQEKNKCIRNSLGKLLPKKMIDPVIELAGITPAKKINEITKKERETLEKIIKNMEITIKGFRRIDEAIITSGGIDIKEINPKTMESKLIEGLYFAGEIIDVDAYTGGFNLQIAYSTGYTAGLLKGGEVWKN